MAAVSFDAHLLLPSPLGLLEYDLLEEAVFVGPAARGGLRAHPAPFPGALGAIRASEAGYLVRPLPGKPPPLVNGEPGAEAPLADGDRLRWGEEVAMFRLARGAVATPPPPAATATPPRERPARREVATPRAGTHPLAWLLGLAAVAVLLLAVMQVIEHLKAEETASSVLETQLPEPATPPRPEADPAIRQLERLGERETGDRSPEGTMQRYRTFIDAHPGDPTSEIARARLRELAARASDAAAQRLQGELANLLSAHQYAAALTRLRAFEAKHGDMSEPVSAEAWRTRIGSAAREHLGVMLREIAPLVRRQPRQAHRALLMALHQFPPDLSPRIVPLLDRAVVAMTRRHRRDGGALRPAPRPPGGEADGGREAAPQAEPSVAERAARRTWATTDLDLRRGRFVEAAKGYDALLRLHADTRTVQSARAALEHGHRIAKAATGGPKALLAVPSEGEGMDVDVTYSFDSAKETDTDWSVEPPFASTLPVRVETTQGEVRMRGASGLFHRLVYADVRIQATAVARVAKDFGLIALDDGPRYRAVLFNVKNTKFTLKKGDAARAQPGHLLWLIGEGVWADADEGVHGYIKIAERPTASIENADRVRIELIRQGTRAEGTLEGRTDGVHLKGPIRGDDGSGVGPVRIGVFTNSGWLNVEEVRVVGTVDATWYRAEIERLVDGVPRPPRKR